MRGGVDFRNQLTHAYSDDALVWAVANRDVPVLRLKRRALIATVESEESG